MAAGDGGTSPSVCSLELAHDEPTGRVLGDDKRPPVDNPSRETPVEEGRRNPMARRVLREGSHPSWR